MGDTDLRPVERESVTHAYTAHTVGTSTTTQYEVGTSCMAKPVSVLYVSDNGGELVALGADGARVVLDDNWLPYFDSYTPLNTRRTDCPAVCPN